MTQFCSIWGATVIFVDQAVTITVLSPRAKAWVELLFILKKQ